MVCLLSADLLENPGKTNPVLELLGIFLIFCCVLYLAYIASRFVGKKFSAANNSRHIKIIERVSLGLDKHLILIRIGSDHYLFLSGKKDFQMVAKVDIDKEESGEPENENKPGETVFNFNEIFDKYLNKGRKKSPVGRKESESTDSLIKNEVLKENVNRLKQMQDKSYDKEV